MKEWGVIRMTRRFYTGAALAMLCLLGVVLTVSVGSAQLKGAIGFEIPGWSDASPVPTTAPDLRQPVSRLCALQPERQRGKGKTIPPSPIVAPGEPMTLERFRGPLSAAASSAAPKEKLMLIDPTNYGDRFLKDLDGKVLTQDPIIVLHETVGSASSAVNYFRNSHPNDADQVSYHTLVRADGTLIYLVPPEKRAFGAGNSVFKGAKGLETVKTNPAFPPSVNNFAYHISLETPADGENNAPRHSGYTAAQYRSLAWLVARTNVPNDRITTHKLVDRSSSRMDPRSFDGRAFLRLLDTLPRTQEVALRCVPPDVTDAPKPDAPKPDTPKPDAQKPGAPKPSPSKPDAPKPDAPKLDAPKPGVKMP
jgi:N-acetylmuramoyl-L-alanine amidase